MALSRVDWIEAALSALGDGGLDAVAVEPVARKLGATKGSFYWHFSNRDDLLDSVLELWEERETTQVVAALASLPDPRQRLIALGRSAYARASGRLGAHTALLLAAHDPRIAPVMRRVTATRLSVLERLYRELGFDDDTSQSYARLAYAVYLGTTDLQRAAPDDPTDAEIDRRVELFVNSVVPAHPAAVLDTRRRAVR